ncbi:hypothetical protein PPACK8108_LOCUS5264 [Phakopsora pachyrhizi]|uniref:Uncharacterized protein n=1 Tax=Phakopsora pachyrhizi TaxID=170000 RepID=A0AAV0AQK1_PHAPC|nr:hypothetical protein PPACK8108_LOCUS5264 [Phakopsora pachyrhizi]
MSFGQAIIGLPGSRKSTYCFGGAESSSFSGLAKDYTNSQVELGHPENLNNQSTSVSSSSLRYSNSFYAGKLKKNFNLGKKIEDWWNTVRSSFTVTLDNKIGPLEGSLGSIQHRWNLISPGPLSARLRSCSFCCLSSNKFPSLDESPAPDDGKSIKPLKLQGEGNEKTFKQSMCAQLVNRVATNTLLSIETMFPVKYWLHLGEFLASKSQLVMVTITILKNPQLTLKLGSALEHRCSPCQSGHFIQYDQFATPRDRILDGAFNSLQELNASENLIPRLLLVGTGATLVSLNVYHAKISSLGQEFFDALVSCESLNLDSIQINFVLVSFQQLTYLRNLLMKDNQLTSLPQSNGQLQRLHTLDLANNNLTSLPKTIWNCSQLIVYSSDCCNV